MKSMFTLIIMMMGIGLVMACSDASEVSSDSSSAAEPNVVSGDEIMRTVTTNDDGTYTWGTPTLTHGNDEYSNTYIFSAEPTLQYNQVSHGTLNGVHTGIRQAGTNFSFQGDIYFVYPGYITRATLAADQSYSVTFEGTDDMDKNYLFKSNTVITFVKHITNFVVQTAFLTAPITTNISGTSYTFEGITLDTFGTLVGGILVDEHTALSVGDAVESYSFKTVAIYRYNPPKPPPRLTFNQLKFVLGTSEAQRYTNQHEPDSNNKYAFYYTNHAAYARSKGDIMEGTLVDGHADITVGCITYSLEGTIGFHPNSRVAYGTLKSGQMHAYIIHGVPYNFQEGTVIQFHYNGKVAEATVVDDHPRITTDNLSFVPIGDLYFEQSHLAIVDVHSDNSNMFTSGLGNSFAATGTIRFYGERFRTINVQVSGGVSLTIDGNDLSMRSVSGGATLVFDTDEGVLRDINRYTFELQGTSTLDINGTPVEISGIVKYYADGSVERATLTGTSTATIQVNNSPVTIGAGEIRFYADGSVERATLAGTNDFAVDGNDLRIKDEIRFYADGSVERVTLEGTNDFEVNDNDLRIKNAMILYADGMIKSISLAGTNSLEVNGQTGTNAMMIKGNTEFSADGSIKKATLSEGFILLHTDGLEDILGTADGRDGFLFSLDSEVALHPSGNFASGTLVDAGVSFGSYSGGTKIYFADQATNPAHGTSPPSP